PDQLPSHAPHVTNAPSALPAHDHNDSSVAAYSFSFQSTHAHRDLHSFPTRRSSDLLGLFLALLPSMAQSVLPKSGTLSATSAGGSEEHTSELQSRFDLVCRLLLEKKKNGVRDWYKEIHHSHIILKT